MKKTLFLLMIIGFSFALKAEELSSDLLTRDLTPVMKNMPKEVSLYTYFNMTGVPQELVTLNGRNEFMQRFFNATMQRFWDPYFMATQYINAGPGVYAAIDPHISKNFGNTVVEIRVPAGTGFIDLHRNISLGDDSVNALVKEGVIARDLLTALFVRNNGRYEFSSLTLKTMIKPEFSYFKKIIQQIFLKKSIVMAEYNWDTSLAGFCRLQRYSAFVLFGKSEDGKMSDPFIKTLVYSVQLPNLSADEVETGARVRKFAQVLADIKPKLTYREKINSVISAYPDATVREELINRTYSCEK